MSENWKPGDPDVAQIAWTSTSKRHGGNGLALRCSDDIDESHWVTQTFGVIPDAWVTDARRLVVIDPEDREQAIGLTELFYAAEITDDPHGYDRMQAALRESANPTPKPKEPTGLGAVVEDERGERWTRIEGNDLRPWHRGGNFAQQWSALKAVRVLSEGVTL